MNRDTAVRWTRRVVVLVVVIGIAVLSYQVVRTGLALRQVASSAGDVRERLGQDDERGARAAADRFADQARVARASSDGWSFAVLARLPVLGDDADAVRRVAQSADTVGAQVVSPALDVVGSVRGGRLRTSDGGVDLTVLDAVHGPVRAASRGASRARSQVADVRASALVGPLGRPVADLQRQLGELDRGLRAADSALDVLPAMLGGEGRRDYLLVVQNNAEIRSTGGLPGSLSVLTAQDGRVDLGDQGDADLFGRGTAPVAPLTQEEIDLYGRNVALDVRDTNLLPDFPRTASLLSRFAARSGRPVDGVVSVDPVTLARVLRATGPVDAGGVRLDSGNALRMLLNEPYQRLPTNEQQDAYFAQVSRGILDALLGGQGDQLELVKVLGEAASQRRLLVWSADASEQRRFEDEPVAAALPRDEGDRPAVGLYLNDSTRAKIQYYLRYDADVRSRGCTAEGRQRVLVQMDLRSQVPTPVSQLTAFVTGNGAYARKGDDAMNLRLYAPTAGRLEALSVDGEAARIKVGQDRDRQVSVLPLTLRPGQSVRVRALFETRPGQTGDPQLQWTPGMTWGATSRTAPTTCR